MEARIITDRQQWNAFVANSSCCNITQSYEWGELAPHLGAEALHLGVVDAQDQLCAAMLVIIGPIPILRRPYFYAPRGPVLDKPNSPALTFMLKVEPSVEDGNTVWLTGLQKQGFRSTPYASHVRHEWILDLRLDEKTILAGMKEKWRYNIRLAGR